MCCPANTPSAVRRAKGCRCARVTVVRAHVPVGCQRFWELVAGSSICKPGGVSCHHRWCCVEPAGRTGGDAYYPCPATVMLRFSLPMEDCVAVQLWSWHLAECFTRHLVGRNSVWMIIHAVVTNHLAESLHGWNCSYHSPAPMA